MRRNTVVSTYLLAFALMSVQLGQAAGGGDDAGVGSAKKICPSPLPSTVKEKVVSCPAGQTATISTISMGVGSDSVCEDTYLHCDGRLLMNVFGGCAFKAICWEATGAQAKVWHIDVPGPTPPAAKK